jgi:DnaJ-class molecular chaperone
LPLSKYIKEPLVETVYTSFTKLMDCYFDMSYWFIEMLLAGPTILNEPGGMPTQLKIPTHLQAEYSLLHLQAGASLTEVRTQYRELAKLYHPDTGGHHTSFLALQQAYERVVEYLHMLG